MGTVRGQTNSWPDLTSVCINNKEPICVILRKVLDVISDCSDEFGVTKVLRCMCGIGLKNC